MKRTLARASKLHENLLSLPKGIWQFLPFCCSLADKWHFGTDPDADPDPGIHTSD